MKTTNLYAFQKEGVRRIAMADGRHILADEPSLGKTLQSLYYGWKFLPENEVGPTVIVVPAHLKINWAREAERHLGQHVEILEHNQVPPSKQLPLWPNQIYVINYDILVPPRWSPRTPLPANSWAGWLAAQKPRYVIADEAHALKNPQSKRSRAFRKLARVAPRVVLLTGTPVTNSPMDLWPLLNITHPELYPSRWEFGMRFTNAVRRPWAWEFPGAKDLDILHRELIDSGVMTRRRKQDVSDQLPVLTQSVVRLDVDLREYRKAENNFLDWLAKQDTLAAIRAAKAEQLARMNYLRQLAGQLKVDAVINYVRDFLAASEGKFLLGAYHKSVTSRLVEAFKGECVLVDGELTGAEKTRRTDLFNAKNSPVRVLIGNYQSAGTGWNCTCTSDAALCELPWLPADVSQFWGRIHGLNRGIPGTAAHVRYITAAETIDDDVCEMLARKQRYSDVAIDGGEPGDVADVYQLTINAMRKRREQT